MILKIILATILLNWCISMQILNQYSQDKNTKITSVVLALLSATLFSLVLII